MIYMRMGPGIECGQENTRMPSVTLYKPDGEIIFFPDVKRVEPGDVTLVLYLEGSAAEEFGPKVITTLPYLISH